MKKILWLAVALLSLSMAQAQTDKKTAKKAKSEKAQKATAKQAEPTVVRSGNEPVPGDTPASPGSNAGANTPLDAPSNMSNSSPANNGTPTQPAKQ